MTETRNLAAAAAALSEINDEMTSMLRDAVRYRWLREGRAHLPQEWGMQGYEDLDKAIDLQMAAEKERDQPNANNPKPHLDL